MVFNDHNSRAKKIGRSPELLSICTYCRYNIPSYIIPVCSYPDAEASHWYGTWYQVTGRIPVPGTRYRYIDIS